MLSHHATGQVPKTHQKADTLSAKPFKRLVENLQPISLELGGGHDSVLKFVRLFHMLISSSSMG